jgi:mannose-6-phosphate isomerase-like protein (cupin superfamily)
MVNVEERPWGNFTKLLWNSKESTTVKIINVGKNKKSSLQKHKNRDEFWFVQEGMLKIFVDDKTMILNKGESITVRSGVKHRFEGVSDYNIVIEISTGDFSEEDITRYEDDYDRL